MMDAFTDTWAACALPAHVVATGLCGGTEVASGPEAICDLLNSPDRIVNQNCKVLVRLDGREPST